MLIKIGITDKITRVLTKNAYAVCGNSDYDIQFEFDAEWESYDTKTARFCYNGNYTDVIFTGDSCAMPVIQNAAYVTIGVYAGDLHTTTPAYIPLLKSITSGGGSPADPTPDVYHQLMEKLSELGGAGPATSEKLGVIKVGENLKISKDGVLSVDTADSAEADNTRPITSAAVAATVGNIEVFLRQI